MNTAYRLALMDFERALATKPARRDRQGEADALIFEILKLCDAPVLSDADRVQVSVAS